MEDSVDVPIGTSENSETGRGIKSRRLDSKNHVLERHPAGRGRHVRDYLPERLEDVQERHHRSLIVAQRQQFLIWSWPSFGRVVGYTM